MNAFLAAWAQVVPFPPGWWEMREAARAVRAGDLAEARRFADLAVLTYHTWHTDPALARHAWRLGERTVHPRVLAALLPRS